MYAELTLDQGATFLATVVLRNDDGSVINVAGRTFTSQIRKSYYSTNPTANISVVILDAPNGNISLNITAANTANIKAGRYLYDIKMVDVGGNTIIRIVEGIMTVTPQVTKS